MDYCGSGGSGRRKVLMDKFQQFLENIDESRAICPEGPCTARTGPCANIDRMGFDAGPRRPGFNPPRAPDYMDPNKRPLITSLQNSVCPVMDVVCPAAMTPGMQSLPNGMSTCPSMLPRPVHIVDPTDYSIPEPIDWGECQLPAYEIERQIREKKFKEKLERDIKERDRISRIRKAEKKRALRPQGPPPPNTEHRAEVPCVQCEPPKSHIPPTYPPQNEDVPLERSPLCPVMDAACPTSFGRPEFQYNGGGGYGNMYGGQEYGGPCNGGGGGGGGFGAGVALDSTQCPAGTYFAAKGGGGGGGGPSSSPCMTAILERERKERERQEREIRERLERERIERERRRLEKAEKDFKAREPYICPGQAKMQKDALKKAKKDFMKGKSINLNLNGRNGNGANGGAFAMSPQEKFGPCVPVSEVAPCDPKACPGTSDNNYPLKEVKSRELVGGVLYTGCDCNKRNGLQHDCKRTLCRGRPECLTKPDPMCIPSGGPGYISPCYPVCQPPCW